MPEPASITKYNLTDHARSEMARREITEVDVTRVLAAPEQVETIRTGRAVYQSRLQVSDPAKTYLLRVFIDLNREPPDVVTVYRTSKIEKYWRVES